MDEQVTPEPAPPASPPARPRRHGSWILAVVIVVVGVVLLIKNTGWLGEDWDFGNWWALFILIPAFGSFANAWNSYFTGERRFNANVARSIMFGLLLLAITVIFLLKLDWGKVWPVLVIIIGVGMVLGWKRD